MKPESTWWKRLFTVIEMTAAIITITLSIILYCTDGGTVRNAGGFDEVITPRQIPVWAYLVLILAPAVTIRLLRIAVIYVVEGKR